MLLFFNHLFPSTCCNDQRPLCVCNDVLNIFHRSADVNHSKQNSANGHAETNGGSLHVELGSSKTDDTYTLQAASNLQVSFIMCVFFKFSKYPTPQLLTSV